MADGRRNNGGHKTAGRKPKADEIKKAEMMDGVLDPLEVWQALGDKVSEGDVPAIKFWIEQRFGKAKESVDMKHELLEEFILERTVETKPKTD